MAHIIRFDEAAATDHERVGGKAANLGHLVRGGFPVPPGFTISTEAYRSFLNSDGLADHILAILNDIDPNDAPQLDGKAAEIRALIVAKSFEQALGMEIAAAYRDLGEGHVAVRSSGSAEDLEGTSFAGLHDTYLDIQGEAEVLDAVRRCWASLWTARAVAYRIRTGFHHLDVAIAVVVQRMIEADVSGVLFTGNPMTSATDECVINASWGLGEAIVGGITTPDMITVKASDNRIVEKVLGSKLVQVVRDPASGKGTITRPTPQDLQSRFSLDDAGTAELTTLGALVQSHYGGFPQDIEWARADGAFYLLQARPITGVEFSWDADVNAIVPGAPVPDDQLWGRPLADEGWAGACTPLMFSWRGLTMVWGHSRVVDIAGYREIGNDTHKLWHFWKGKAYFNVDADRGFIEQLTPPPFRNHLIYRLPSPTRQQTLDAPFDWMKYVTMYLRYHTLVPDQGFAWIKLTERFQTAFQVEHDGLTPEQLRQISDEDLKAHLAHLFNLEWEFGDAIWPGMILFMRDMNCLMDKMIEAFYTGANSAIAADLLAGTPRRGATARENADMFALAAEIRRSSTLNALFTAAESAEHFFDRLDESDDGRAFAASYASFVAKHGHRGHSDRDLYFLRRAETPAVDFGPLKALLSMDTLIDPSVMEEAVNQRREAARAEIIANFSAQPFGEIKTAIFKIAHDYTLECIIARDEERHFHDRCALSTKRAYAEVGRRLQERGKLQEDRDFFFLTEPELYQLLDGAPMTPLIQAKIAGRKRDFDRVNDKLVSVPLFLRHGRPATFDDSMQQDGLLSGIATSRGTVTGTARVIKSLSEIHRVRQGEILVVNATDPGWTPVFMLIKGIVLETGGMLAHGSLLAREYGFPAVQIEDAMAHIPDGATITLDGDNGIVRIEKETAMV